MGPDSVSLVLLAVLVILTLLWWLSTRRPSGIPPGPGRALPLLGHLYLMDKDPRNKFGAWRRQYGDVFSLYMGSRLVVVLNGYPAIKEALVKFADVFSDRPHTFLTDKISENKGVAGTSGSIWKEQRKTSLEILREFGMGKNMLADRVQEEVTHYIHAVEDLQGAPTDLTLVTQASVSNNICSIVYGRRFEYDNPEFSSYLRAMDENLAVLAGTALLNLFPVLEYLPGDIFGIKKVMSNVKLVQSFVDRQVAEHLKVHREKEKGADYIHAYLHQILQRQNSGDYNTTINMENLIKCIADLFVAGTETTSTALRWAMLYFLHYPEVQEKCYREICDVVGTGRLPNVSDRSDLTYVEATISEVLRKGDVAPLSLSHGISRDVKFRDYVIPKDTIVIPNLHSVLQDPEIWGDPENFRPERFIGPDGKLRRPEEFIPFGIGHNSTTMPSRILRIKFDATRPERFLHSPHPFSGHGLKTCLDMRHLGAHWLIVTGCAGVPTDYLAHNNMADKLAQTWSRRICLGESLARLELFLYLSALVQRFRFLPEQEVPPSLEGVFGLTHSPKHYKIRAVLRK